ncbi:Lipoprotein OS=Streptomyces aurantiogriseus OX=66870 GN=GCM10010251_77200 PE=4 SV=1 [Streptomyces aurantiogriseus]
MRCAGAALAALGTLTACGGPAEPCELLDLVPEVAVTWQADALPYGADATYRLCVATHCASGAPLVYKDLVRVKVRLPEGFDERKPTVTLKLSGGRGAKELTASRTITLRQTKEGCDQALTGSLQLTADGELKEAD